MKTGLAARNAKVCANDVTKWAAELGKFEYEPTARAELDSAETALNEAVRALESARQEYEKNYKPNF